MVTADSAPKAFVSHSHADKPTAEALARALMARGIEAWFDDWEIQAGDSLIQKITDGLEQCAMVLVLLSPDAVSSKWVREELDLALALVKRLEGVTRVLPIVARARACAMPLALRALLWLDLPQRAWTVPHRRSRTWRMAGPRSRQCRMCPASGPPASTGSRNTQPRSHWRSHRRSPTLVRAGSRPRGSRKQRRSIRCRSMMPLTNSPRWVSFACRER